MTFPSSLITYYIRKTWIPRPSMYFRELINAIGMGIIGVDRHKFIISANRAAYDMFGYNSDELIGMPLEALLPPDLRARHNKHLDIYMVSPMSRVMNGGQIVQGYTSAGARFSIRVALDSFIFEGEKYYAALITPTEAQ